MAEFLFRLETVEGEPAEPPTLSAVGLRGMAKRTTFVWYVHGLKVATRTGGYDTSLGARLPSLLGH